MDLNDHGYAEVYAEVYSEGDTFENSEGVKEECWETDIPPIIYRYMSHAAVAVGSRPERGPLPRHAAHGKSSTALDVVRGCHQ